MSSIFSSCDFVAGWISGICGLVVGHPLDTAKVWKQTVPNNTNTKDILINIFQTGGIKGYFRGMSFPVITAGALNAVHFGIYGNSLRLMQDYRQVAYAISWSEELPYPDWHLDVFIAGCLGGLFSTVITCPVELIKTQMQTQTFEPSLQKARTHIYSNPWECLRDQYKHRGLTSLYRGMVPVLYRDVLSSGLYFSAYVHVRELLNSQHTYSIMLAGGFAGAVSWIVILPVDVIKNRIQADSKTKPMYRGIIDCAVKSYKHDGLPVFFRGMCEVLSTGVYFYAYVHVRELWNSQNTYSSIMLAGGFAGAVSWIVSLPVDVIKNRIQADSKTKPMYRGMTDCIVKSYKHDGLPVFFRGFWLAVLRAIPVNAVTFASYEFVVSFCS